MLSKFRYRMLSGILALLLVPFALSAYTNLEIVGGIGALSTNVPQKNYLTGTGSTKAETVNTVAMSEAIQIGIRIMSYSELGIGHFIIGGELNGLFARPTISSDWRFLQYDRDDKLIAQSLQSASSANAPAFNSARGLFHLGYSIPAAAWVAIDFGAIIGLGMSEAKYVFQSPYTLSQSNGKSSGASGIGAQAGLRFALHFWPRSAVAFGIEYRYIADGFGSILYLLPGLQSNAELVTTTGHQLLFSAGYRFGIESPRQAKGS